MTVSTLPDVKLERTYADETQARNAHEVLMRNGVEVSLMGFDISRGVYAFDVHLDGERAQSLAHYRREFPAVSTSDHWGDRVVTEGHAIACAVWGHASHKIDDVEQARCPRCGEAVL